MAKNELTKVWQAIFIRYKVLGDLSDWSLNYLSLANIERVTVKLYGPFASARYSSPTLQLQRHN